MAKLNTIFFLLLTIFVSSCQQTVTRSVEQERFDEALRKSSLSFPKKGTYGFILWNESSCSGCKKTSAALLRAVQSGRVRLIVPPSDEALLQTADTPFIFIDSARVFQKYYIGVNNVGLILLKNGQTISITDYNSEEIPFLKKDLKDFLTEK